MGIEDIQISEELETNAPSIKYSGNEGPKSPQEMEQMIMAQLEEEYLKYVDDMMEQGMEPMTLEQFMQQAMAEGQMAGGNPLPQDPTKPVNPFAPKPTGPVLPNRQMAAGGGIMGLKQIGKPGGRVEPGIMKYGMFDFITDPLKKFKDKFVDDIIPNEIKENPLAAAAAAGIGANYFDIIPGERSSKGYLGELFNKAKKTFLPRSTEEYSAEEIEKGVTKDGKTIIDKSVYGIKEPGFLKKASDFVLDLNPNTLATIGGGLAGLFTKNQPDEPTGMPNDNTAIGLDNLKKTANVLDQKQGMAAGLNFLPSVAARKYSPAEMANTYAQAANGGRIGFSLGGDPKMVAPQINMPKVTAAEEKEKMAQEIIQRLQDSNLTDDVREILQQQLMMIMPQSMPAMAMGGRIGRAEGGIMDLGGMEKDYRAEGGFVPIGREEKADDVPARLSVNEFVFTADAVRNAGGGDIDQGAQVMENMMKHLEQGGQVSEESQGMQGARDMFATSERLSEVI